MTIKELHKNSALLPDYTGYIVLVFCWYFLDNMYTSMQPLMPENFVEPLAQWIYRLFVGPFLLAGVFGGIYRLQRTEDISSVMAFFKGAKTFYWRMVGANLCATIFIITITIVATTLGGTAQPDFGDNKALLAMIRIPYSAITLFWFAGIIVRRKIFPGLLIGVKTLLAHPSALVVGIAWGAIGFTDIIVVDYISEPTSFAVHGIRAGVLAVARILAIVYAFAAYEKVWGNAFDESPEETALPAGSPSSGDGWVKASIGFTFVSFLPLFHVVALVLGIIALKRKKQFLLGPAIACCVGGFFTIFYFLLITGWIVGASVPSSAPRYDFLTDVNPDLKPQVMLLEQGSSQEIQQQLGGTGSNSSERHWAVDSTLALAKYQSYDLEGALTEFSLAAKKKPERSEFYYYYGLALLENGQEDMAARQFEIALKHQPRLEQAERYLALIDSTYTPSLIVSSLGFVIILLASFTLHEFGHAFAAWKLGDDTAKNEGRLTLNPIPHLDMFGSLVLPAILLFQQSEVMFGWARPVPVNRENFKDPQKDHMRVSFAGPAMNLFVSLVSLVILGCLMLFLRLLWPETLSLNFATPYSSVALVGPPFARGLMILVVFLKQLFYTSLVLGCFNLIPVPPLDGSWILSGLLPQGLSNLFENVRKYSFVFFLLLVVTPVFDYLLSIPIGLAWGGLQLLVSAMGLG